MARWLAALRTLVYVAAFTWLWCWLELAVRDALGRAELSPAWRLVGAALMLAGGAMVASCLLSFVMVGRGTPAPFDAPRRLVPTGPYRWVRNPMYLGSFGFLAGFGLWHRSLAMVLFVVPVALAIHAFVLLYEEPTLRRRFGEEYGAYRSRVRRWIPGRPRGFS